jgi:hypothetical protein
VWIIIICFIWRRGRFCGLSNFRKGNYNLQSLETILRQKLLFSKMAKLWFKIINLVTYAKFKISKVYGGLVWRKIEIIKIKKEDNREKIKNKIKIKK